MTLERGHVNINTLHTVITEIECTLNDHPLKSVSTDSNDVDPLSPSDYSMNANKKTLLYPSTTEMSDIQKLITSSHIVKRTKYQRKLL